MLTDLDILLLSHISSHPGVTIYDLQNRFGVKRSSGMYKALRRLTNMGILKFIQVNQGNRKKYEYYIAIKPVCNEGALVYSVDGNILILNCKFRNECDGKHCKLLEYYKKHNPQMYELLKDMEIRPVSDSNGKKSVGNK